MSSKLKQLGQIIEGHANNLLGKAGMLEGDTKAIAEQRFEICKSCIVKEKPCLSQNLTCCMCGCYMPAKTKAISAKCPLGKW